MEGGGRERAIRRVVRDNVPRNELQGAGGACFVIYSCITESGVRTVSAWEMPRARLKYV